MIRQIHAVIGPDAFRGGLQQYMKQHAYGNTVTTDLWAAWETASGMPVANLMSSWTNQVGTCGWM